MFLKETFNLKKESGPNIAFKFLITVTLPQLGLKIQLKREGGEPFELRVIYHMMLQDISPPDTNTTEQGKVCIFIPDIAAQTWLGLPAGIAQTLFEI